MGLAMSKAFKKRTDLHLLRKTWHFLGVLSIIIIYHNMSYHDAFISMAILTTFVVVLETARLKIKPINKFVKRNFSALMRDNERHSYSGVTALFIGCFLIMAFFPRPIVRLSLFFLAAADPIASYFGVRYGKDKLFKNKSLQGSLAAFVVCTLISFVFYLSQDLMDGRIVIASLLSGLIGAGSEMFSTAKLDDNFTIPVLSSLLLWGLFYVFGVL